MTEVRPPDLEMRVKALYDGGRTHLNFNLHSPTGVVAFAHRDVEGPPLYSSPEEFQNRLLKKIDRLVGGLDIDGSQLSSQERDRKLAGLGQDLWRDLFPYEIRSAYREIRRSVRSWAIISDEPWIPWELVKPYDDSIPNAILDDDYLALQFELIRWLAGDKNPALNISIYSMAVFQTSEGLPLAESEKQILTDLAQEHPLLVDVTPLELSAPTVRNFLETGGADLVHFIAHGVHASQTEESGILFPDGSMLRPIDLDGPLATRLAQSRPLVFLNACYAGRQGWALTRLGGWAVRFVRVCGCGAFIAPMWPVRDSSAFAFARAFYRSLGGGAHLGKAAKEARRHAFQLCQGDPSVLAYAVYGHVHARVLFGEGQVANDSMASDQTQSTEVTSRPDAIESRSAGRVSHRRVGSQRSPKLWISLIAAVLAAIAFSIIHKYILSPQAESSLFELVQPASPGGTAINTDLPAPVPSDSGLPISFPVIAIDDATGDHIAGAQLMADEEGISTETDSQGRCTLSVRPGAKKIRLTVSRTGYATRNVELTIFKEMDPARIRLQRAGG